MALQQCLRTATLTLWSQTPRCARTHVRVHAESAFVTHAVCNVCAQGVREGSNIPHTLSIISLCHGGCSRVISLPPRCCRRTSPGQCAAVATTRSCGEWSGVSLHRFYITCFGNMVTLPHAILLRMVPSCSNCADICRIAPRVRHLHFLASQVVRGLLARRAKTEFESGTCRSIAAITDPSQTIAGHPRHKPVQAVYKKSLCDESVPSLLQSISAF